MATKNQSKPKRILNAYKRTRNLRNTNRGSAIKAGFRKLVK